MIERDLTEHYAPSPRIHVIGFGKQVEPAISNLGKCGLDEITAYMAQPDQDIKPDDDVILAILCIDDDEEMAMEVSKIFYEAYVLTLIVTTKTVEGKYFDSMTKVNLSDIGSVVKSLLDPLFLHGQISLDFDDLDTILRDSRHFLINNAVTKAVDNRIADALRKIEAQVLAHLSGYDEFLIIIIYFNPNLEPPFKIYETTPLTEFILKLPNNTNVIWAISRDEGMPNDEIRLSAIISGKKLNP